MRYFLRSNKVSDARDKRWTYFKKTPTEQLEGGSQVDAPEATVPVSSEEETVAEVQQEVAEELKIEATTAAFSDAEKKKKKKKVLLKRRVFQKKKPKLIELFRARKNSKSSWRRFISGGSRILSNELGELGGAGHFFGNDSFDARRWMEEKELRKVLRLLSLGEKRINLKEREFRTFLTEKKRRETQKKFHVWQNWNVTEAGWTIQFQTAYKDCGGDGKYFHLWLEQKGAIAKFKATAQQINSDTGEETNRRELQSETDGTRQRIKFEYVLGAGCFVRFNIKLL